MPAARLTQVRLASRRTAPLPSVTVAMPVSIRSHLLMLVLAILAPALLGAGWLVLSTIDSERRANERTLRDTARALSVAVDNEFNQRAAVARALAQSRWLDDGSTITPAALARFRAIALHGLQDARGWVQLRTDERVLLDTRWPAGVSAPPAAAAVPALAEQSVVRSLPATESHGAHADVVEPVRREGRVLLNVVVGLPASELQQLIDAHALTDDAIGAVVDAQGLVMAQRPGGPPTAGSAPTPALAAPALAQREGLIEGRRAVAYYSTSPTGWTYVSGLDRERYDGLFSQAVQRMIIGAAVLLAIAVLGAMAVSQRVVAPVMALKSAARRMHAGLPIPYTHTGISECDEVGRALTDASLAIQASRDSLSRQVDEAVERTRQAEQRASQTQRVGALGQLTGGIAHDFNNLLGIIGNSIHLIQRHPAAKEMAGPIASTLRAVQAGSQLTQHLLRFAGRRPVRPQRIALERYLLDAQASMRSMLGQRIEISVRVAPGTAPIRVDPGELELALINLGLNARDAMPAGGELRLQARDADAAETEGLPALEPPRRWVMLSICDDGQGIASDIVGRVFEPFFTTRGPGRGSGLGLSQVHGFCVQAGGTVRLDSTQGLGTAVTLLLPSASDGPGDLAPVATAAAPGVACVRGLRVLVVEDNDELGRATAALLCSHGALVTRAAHAAAAVALLQSHAPFDVVLSDMRMPEGMDGFALAQWIARQHPALPVVLISGYHTRRDTKGLLVLTKPCPQEELLAALRDAANRACRPQPRPHEADAA
jgi:signal transduction histidine kinase/ActR/RegA family two-component response regulator